MRAGAYAPRVKSVQNRCLEAGACIGCESCPGLCPALLEMLSLPEAVLGSRA
jgi:formate hydrogenlyase subunit 6/NADH:ubiquinone oxidoreductase subunit I